LCSHHGEKCVFLSFYWPQPSTATHHHKDAGRAHNKDANPNLKPIFARPRPGDIKHSYADTSKAKRLLGFNPKINLEQGLTELLEINLPP